MARGRCKNSKQTGKNKIKCPLPCEETAQNILREPPLPVAPVLPPGEPPQLQADKLLESQTRGPPVEQEEPETPLPTPSLARKPRPFLSLPHEIIDLILQHTLTHSAPVPVDALFNKHNAFIPPPLDYRILHANRELYLTGLRHYYGLNTFSIGLALFSTAPQTVAPARWPHGCGLGGAAMWVRRVHVSAREFRNWRDAVPMLRGFEGLQKVVFDVREQWAVDAAVDGSVNFEGGWVEVAACEEMVEVLEGAEVKVGEGGIWVGGQTADEAVLAMEGLLEDALKEGRMRLGL